MRWGFRVFDLSAIMCGGVGGGSGSWGCIAATLPHCLCSPQIDCFAPFFYVTRFLLAVASGKAQGRPREGA